jgi:O-methyltransferase involved in polyketide biosynthesis
VAEKLGMSLEGSQETLLVPLYGRATLTRAGSDLIDDPKAVAMVEAIDYDFSRLDGTMSLVGSVLRTRIFDRWVSRWLEANPTGTVVEVGAGLNTRFERVDNGEARWFELDLPEVIALRRRFFADTERRTMLAASVTDDAWHDTIAATGGPWFFAVEAVLIYLEPAEVADALTAIGRRFPGARLATDTWGSWMRDHQDEHDTIGQFESRFTWFCDDLTTFDIGDVDLTVLDSYSFVDAPTDILDLLPPELRAMLPALADDPQMTAYRQNLMTVGRPADSPRASAPPGSASEPGTSRADLGA